ncbi:MAG: prepilin-type N-terminal cleavage/methylation domain-containing protein [Candidatus Moranbacteria bacterium]|nr:prepilin-type N-terminal cleavage/methylation domain-containing protein [Candidatus Moranbacteria bacterium]MDD3964777.1 prepilin-type N-terminal cleavage/methylation domain-containing protein [Candidatus Moranbacteria bacterium]
MTKKNLKGMTLVELMVAISIMLIAMGGFTTLFIKSWDTNKFVLEEGMASSNASYALGKVIKQLRGVKQADNGDFPVESADDFDLKVYVDIDHDDVTERVHYFLDLDTHELQRGVTNPTGSAPVSYPASDDSVSVIAEHITNTNANPLFLYYNKNYPGDTTNNPIATPADVSAIRLIQVHLWVDVNPAHPPNNINMESFVDLRNLKYYE